MRGWAALALRGGGVPGKGAASPTEDPELCLALRAGLVPCFDEVWTAAACCAVGEPAAQPRRALGDGVETAIFSNFLTLEPSI